MKERSGPATDCDAWGKFIGRGKMYSVSKKLAVVSVFSLYTTVSALAGSVTQPGETVGVAAGAPLPHAM